MRLVCPSCGARYEVPEENIPATGRDVQCLACDTTWFQKHSGAKASLHALSDQSDQGRGQPYEAVLEGVPAKAIVEEAASAKPTDDASPLKSAVEGRYAPRDLKEESAKRRLHPTVVEVLREEARREAQVRSAETLGTQTELGSTETTQFVATVPNAEENGNAAGVAKGSATSQPDKKTLEKELDKLLDVNKSVIKQTLVIENQDNAHPEKGKFLPNIEDISPAIISDEEAPVGEAIKEASIADVASKKMGRLGFVMGLLIIVGLFAIYEYEDRITAAYAPLLPAMGEYVSFVDRMRAYSDQSLYNAIAWLEFQAERARQNETQE